jgi:hypothetical protein
MPGGLFDGAREPIIGSMRRLLRATGLDPAKFCTLIVCAAFASVSWGCGGPSAPTPTHTPDPSPGPTSNFFVATVLSIIIVPDITTLTIGQAQPFSMSVELSPGFPPSGPVPVWSSTSPAVVAMDFSGTATALTEGEAIIQVLFRGKTATRRLQVVP